MSFVNMKDVKEMYRRTGNASVSGQVSMAAEKICAIIIPEKWRFSTHKDGTVNFQQVQNKER